MLDFDEDLLELAERWTQQSLGGLECQILRLTSQADNCPVQEAEEFAIVFLHGGGEAWRVERSRIFTPERMQRLCKTLGRSATIILPASPMIAEDGKNRWWYFADASQIQKLLIQAKAEESTSVPSSAQSTSAPSPAQSGIPDRAAALELLKDGEPAALDISRASILGLLAALETEFHVPCERVVLAGFSQGAAVAMDVAVHLLPRLVAGIGFFSGSLMCRQRWRACVDAAGEEIGKLWRQTPVLQAHGRTDFSVGVNGGRWLHTFCKDDLHMQNARYFEFPGGHTIPPDLVDRFLFELFSDVTNCMLRVASEIVEKSDEAERTLFSG